MNADQYLNILTGLELFKSFSSKVLKAKLSASRFEIKTYEKDRVIHLQNEKCYAMEIILEGRVAVQKIDQEGNVLTINVFSAPEVMGAHLIFSTRNLYPMTVVAESKVIMLSLYKDLIVQLGQSNPGFMLALLKVISDRIVILADKIRAISHKTIRQQIIDFLTYEYHIQQNQVIRLNYTKKELAERLGIQRTSLSRELNKMRRDGLLEYDARAITIKRLNILGTD